jgi:predicted acetyltransferase
MVAAMEVRHPIPIDEAEGWTAAMVTAHLGSVSDEQFPERVERTRRNWIPERTWGATDHGRWVATLWTEPRAMTVPGFNGAVADIPTDALTRVAVTATHRRRGLLRAMLTDSLRAAADRGDPVSILISAEWPIYGRYGYAPATTFANYAFHPRIAGGSVEPDAKGTLRQIHRTELADVAGDIFERSRLARAGQVDRRGSFWPRNLGTDGYPTPKDLDGTWILHESPDGPDGFLMWQPKADFSVTGEMATIEVLDLAAASDGAYRNLWAYLSGIDLVGEVILHERAVDEPVRWLLHDGRALQQTYAGDHTWARMLDVPKALAARGYAVPGRIVLEVVDDDGDGFAAGRYVLDSDSDGASCTTTTESADLVLSQRVLAGAYLGDNSLRALSAAGRVDEETPGALARIDAMFATPLRPWNATGF